MTLRYSLDFRWDLRASPRLQTRPTPTLWTFSTFRWPLVSPLALPSCRYWLVVIVTVSNSVPGVRWYREGCE